MYLIVKQSHMILVIISVAFFQLRFWYQLRQPPASNRWLRTLPHGIDTLLLLSGLWLIVMSGLTPWQHGWLGIKLIAVVAYILSGMVAMKPRGLRQWAAYLLATALVIYIMMVARFKSPGPWI